MEGKPLTDGKAKSLVAYHEVGHAVCGTLTPGHDAVQKVTLIPRGQARGLTWFIPGEDPTLISKQQIFARIVGALGGRAAEEIIFGEAEVTSGASGDLQQVGVPGHGVVHGWPPGYHSLGVVRGGGLTVICLLKQGGQ